MSSSKMKNAKFGIINYTSKSKQKPHVLHTLEQAMQSKALGGRDIQTINKINISQLPFSSTQTKLCIQMHIHSINIGIWY